MSISLQNILWCGWVFLLLVVLMFSKCLCETMPSILGCTNCSQEMLSAPGQAMLLVVSLLCPSGRAKRTQITASGLSQGGKRYSQTSLWTFYWWYLWFLLMVQYWWFLQRGVLCPPHRPLQPRQLCELFPLPVGVGSKCGNVGKTWCSGLQKYV